MSAPRDPRTHWMRTRLFVSAAAFTLAVPPLWAATPRIAEGSPSLHAASVTASPVKAQAAMSTLNVWDRAAVAQHYKDNYLPDDAGGVKWTGSFANDDAGTTSDAWKAAELKRINYFRTLAGTYSLTLDPASNGLAQEAAFLMAANGQVSPFPPSTWTLWSKTRADAAAKSDLLLGKYGVAAADAYIEDAGSDNTAAGHRLLNLGMYVTTVGLGDVPTTDGKSSANAIYLTDAPWVLTPPRDGFIAWPNQGFVPYQNVYDRWSFQVPYTYTPGDTSLHTPDLSEAIVTATFDGAPFTVLTEYRDVQIVFRLLGNPQDITGEWLNANNKLNKPIRITVKNAKLDGVIRTYSYTVIPTDVTKPAPPAPTFTAPSSFTAHVDQSFWYQLYADTAFYFTANGLPDGLSLDPNTGIITGTPTTTGTYVVTFTASNGSVTSTSRTFNVLGAPVPSNAKLVNISTRASVGTGDNVLIAGFVINGTAPKKVIIRAAGPALKQYNVTGVLDDPVLELYNSKGEKTLQNDDWDSAYAADFAAVGAGAWTAGSKDAAIITALQPGLYTAIVRGKNSTSGVAIVEAFEQDIDNRAAKVVNISSRSLVKTGDDVMIAGFVINGDQPKTVVIRAAGPALATAGISNFLPDPVLEIYDSQGAKFIENDDWDSSIATDFSNVGAAQWPLGSKDAALVLTLKPGLYTAIVRGKNNATGVSLVEVFDE